jgi:hypothetical protein
MPREVRPTIQERRKCLRLINKRYLKAGASSLAGGKVNVNVVREWRKGFPEPLRVVTNPEPESRLRICRKRMKVNTASVT